jgi:hypothetical protein
LAWTSKFEHSPVRWRTMANEQLKLVFKYDTFDPQWTMRRVAEILVCHGIGAPEFESDGLKLSTPRLLSKLTGVTDFDVTGHGFNFIFASLPRFQLDLLIITTTDGAIVRWDDWVSGLIEGDHFVMAWVVDIEYDHWQNAVDPQQYEVVGKSFAHLPLRSNGMPYPLDRMEIDTSRNPGRWRFGAGYIEAVGATMWLGTSFWELTRADKRKLDNLKWLQCFEETQSVTRIKAADRCFTTGEGELGERQLALRSLLFPYQIPDRPGKRHHPP